MNTSTPMQSVPAPIPEQAIPHQRLEQFPIAFFSIIMGIAGLTLAWQKAHIVLGVPPIFHEALPARLLPMYGPSRVVKG